MDQDDEPDLEWALGPTMKPDILGFVIMPLQRGAPRPSPESPGDWGAFIRGAVALVLLTAVVVAINIWSQVHEERKRRSTTQQHDDRADPRPPTSWCARCGEELPDKPTNDPYCSDTCRAHTLRPRPDKE